MIVLLFEVLFIFTDEKHCLKPVSYTLQQLNYRELHFCCGFILLLKDHNTHAMLVQIPELL